MRGRAVAVAARADADGLVRAPDLQRLVPVARAHAADRGQARRVVRGLARVRVGEVAPALRDRAGEALAATSRACPRRATGDERDARRARRRRMAAGRPGRGALGESEPDGEADHEQHDQHRDDEDPELVAGRRRAGRAGRGPRLRPSWPNAHRPTSTPPTPRGREDRDAAQAQRHERRTTARSRSAEREQRRRASRRAAARRAAGPSAGDGERVDERHGRCAGRRATGTPGTAIAAISPTAFQ